jgi:hypothetical protein
LPLLRSRPGGFPSVPRVRTSPLCLAFPLPQFPLGRFEHSPGILTVAHSARLNDTEAFPGLSWLAARVGQTAISLGGSSPAGTLVEGHAEGALLRAKNARGVQAEIKILGPKALQVTPRRETWSSFTGRNGGSFPKPRLMASGAQTAGISGKVTILIVAAAAAGITAWGVHAAVPSGNGPESPAKP